MPNGSEVNGHTGFQLTGRVHTWYGRGVGFLTTGTAPYWLFVNATDVALDDLPLAPGDRVSFTVTADHVGFRAADVARLSGGDNPVRSLGDHAVTAAPKAFTRDLEESL